MDTKFSGQIVDYDGDIEIPGKFGASFENPMYDELVSYFSILFGENKHYRRALLFAH